ncbi:hypothetical protein BJP40_06350 [Streptomyces sp. CC53]|uniref:hypothetical protein n=1 Tax=Streptomyces sp. CC53 TaxID=1906740 RepID=UPI0008DE8812|nr:hypothetical protein [Streptomyces sp. CC53]OII61144.1 hypothetical protein BJP40_06350 [Streptomyces sp. CC53]
MSNFHPWPKRTPEYKVRRALEELGDHPEERLKEMGVTGVPGDPEHCLLANYLNAKIPLPGGARWTVGPGWGYGIPIPDASAALAREFDHGGHADMVDWTQPAKPARFPAPETTPAREQVKEDVS